MRYFLFFLIIAVAWAQYDAYQLSGMVLNRHSGEPIPYVHIVATKSRQIVIANKEGFFSLAVDPYDTLIFSALGYHKGRLSIPDYLKEYQPKDQYIYVIQYLVEDTIELPAVVIFPYKNAQELKTAIVNMPVQTEPMQIAYNNVSPQIVKYFMEHLPADPEERVQAAYQRYLMFQRQAFQRPYVPLLDPIAVMRLVNYLAKQAKSKKRSKNYNYWIDED